MTGTQLYRVMGLPVFAMLTAMLVNMIQLTTINSRITGFENSMNARFSSFESSVDGRFTRFETRFDTLMGKVIDIDNRLTRVEERLEHR